MCISHIQQFLPNLPVRFLIDLAQEYQIIVEKAQKSLYVPLPTPHCMIFYNGDKEVPEEHILRLSDAFENKVQKADVELTVKVLNIKYGHNAGLMEQCKTFGEYAEFSEDIGMLSDLLFLSSAFCPPFFQARHYEETCREIQKMVLY